MSNFENRVQKDLVTEAVFTEANEEFILPDYMPEIARVLRLNAALLPEEHFAGSDGVEFSGRIEYRLLYSDSAGEITEAPLEGRYRYRVASGEEHVLPYTEEKIESVGARPTAPRKLSIRTRISARPHLLCEEARGAHLSDMVGEAKAEAVWGNVPLLEKSVCASGLLHKEGRFTIEETSPDALTLLSIQSALLPEGAEAHDGYLSARGKLIYTLLLKKAGECPFTRIYTLPFEEEITSEAVKAGDAVSLRAFLGTPAVTLEADGDGCALLFDAEYSLMFVLSRNRPFSYLKDFYVHGERHEITRKGFSSSLLVGAGMGNFTVGGTPAFPADFKKQGTLLPHFSLKEASASTVGERVILEGTILSHLLSFEEGASDKCELSFPFRVELPLGKAVAAGDSVSFAVTPTAGSAQIAGDGVHLSTEIWVSACVLRPVSLSLPEGARKTEDIAAGEANAVVIYYPKDEDSLWSVGKRYGVPLSLLKEQNGIPENEDADVECVSSLDGYAYLFVRGL